MKLIKQFQITTIPFTTFGIVLGIVLGVVLGTAMGMIPTMTRATATEASELSYMIGEVAGDTAGFSVDSAGDVDGDGYDDVLVGAPSNGDRNIGAVYLVYGRNKRYGEHTFSDDISTIVKFSGLSNNDKLGYQVAGAGDINADGFDDFMMSAIFNDTGGLNSGAVYVVYGQADRLIDQTVQDLTVYQGAQANNKLGRSLSSAGDVNGDGFADVLMSAPYGGASRRGVTYLLYGSATGLTVSDVTDATQITGEKQYDYSGWAVGSAGDVDNDGYDDILISAYRNDDRTSNAGAAYLLYGSNTELADMNLSSAVQFSGEAAADRLGSAVNGVGDVNGDGYDDFMLGAQYNDFGGDNAGSAYLFYGQADRYTATNAETGVRFYGTETEDYVGGSLHSLGDGNQDGLADIVLGAPSGHPLRGGNVYIIYGQADIFTETSVEDLEGFFGENREDLLGYSVSGADLNGDGQDELLAGAYDYHSTGANIGALYIGYLPIRNCDNSAALGGILADYPLSNYKLRKYKKNNRLRIVVERRGRQAFLVNCKTDEILQTITFNNKVQRKILARVFTVWGQPMFIAVTRTPNKRAIKIYLFKQKKKELILTDYIKRKWRPRGLRLKVNRRRHIVLEKGKEQKYKVKYDVTPSLELRLRTGN